MDARGGYGSEDDPPMLDHDGRMDDQGEWVADPKPPETFCVNYGLVIVNVMLLMAAITMVVVGSYAEKSSITQMCQPCRDISVAATAIGCIFLTFCVIGLLALFRRAVLVLVTYVVVLILLVLAIISLTIASTVYAANGVDLGPNWRSRVGANDSLICEVQKSYSCSGWQRCCGPFPNQTANTPVSWNESVNNDDFYFEEEESCRWDSEYCLDTEKCRESNAQFTKSCKSSVQHWLKTILIPFGLGMICVTGLVLFGGFLSTKLRKSVRSNSLIIS
eukprot:TRINITY_DN38366_c0_g1_i1.p1 TRINITY_DN38366_c0_g1~~TRINITY_DN38366_c0_g1_i1.p1  ORF type:complete len:276 (+),score=21.86 TRINITY_DN38366_c0_g1_i1:74-901(+)